MPPPLTPAERDEIIRVANEVGHHHTYRIADRVGRHPRTVRKVLACVKSASDNGVSPPPPAGQPASEPATYFAEKADGTATAGGVTNRPVKSLADVVEACEIDLTVWHVERYEVSAWTVGMKVADDDATVIVRTQQYRVKAYLRRLQPRSLHLATEAIY